MTSNRYDVVVVGVGGVGSGATAHLAARGADVLGLERFDVPHGYGSSHDVTRLIRKASPEHPASVPLAERAYDLWDDLESDHQGRLRYETGSLDVGPTGSPSIENVRQACDEHGLASETLSGDELMERYPAYELPDGGESNRDGRQEQGRGSDRPRDERTAYTAIYQPDGGFLDPGECLVAHVNRAHENGATIRARERVTSWRSTPEGVRVLTDHDEYRADRLVIAAGPWTDRFVEPLEGVLRPERQVVARLQPATPERFAPDRFPAFTLEVPEGRYYGFPIHAVPGFAFGRYHHRDELVDPDRLERQPMPADERLLRRFATEYFPEGSGPTMGLRPCLSATTPDGNFVLDTLSDDPVVTVAAGFAGDGFAFTSVVGEILADLTLEGETDHEIGPFSLDRFS